MKISTILIIAGLLIISLYCLVEVNYYSAVEKENESTTDTPVLNIPKIGVYQNINNKSVDYGIYHEPQSEKPGSGTVVLFGHRTLHGSPFLKLDQLQNGDNLTLEWPGIGNVEYQVVNTTIVPASYRLSVEQGNTVFLITCYPLGSTKERLIVKADQKNIYPLKKANSSSQPSWPYAWLIIGIFCGAGLGLTYIYPAKDDRVYLFIATIALTLFLVVGYFFPTPSNAIESQLSNISNYFGV
jgi:LPXTG-site transpeptidase (sortase) family protein